jgi:hypothetical protein
MREINSFELIDKGTSKTSARNKNISRKDAKFHNEIHFFSLLLSVSAVEK